MLHQTNTLISVYSNFGQGKLSFIHLPCIVFRPLQGEKKKPQNIEFNISNTHDVHVAIPVYIHIVLKSHSSVYRIFPFTLHKYYIQYSEVNKRITIKWACASRVNGWKSLDTFSQYITSNTECKFHAGFIVHCIVTALKIWTEKSWIFIVNKTIMKRFSTSIMYRSLWTSIKSKPNFRVR